MKSGDPVIFQGKQTFIERVNDNGTVLIANPFFCWEEEGLCVESGLDYDTPYWVTVESIELN